MFCKFGSLEDLDCYQEGTDLINEIAAGIMNGFKLECKNKKVLKFFEKIVRKLQLNHWLKMISHEYFLLGDVFPFTEIR